MRAGDKSPGSTPASTAVREARVGDLVISHKVYGRGHALLLIHGLGGSHRIWSEDFLEALSRRFTVVAPDNRGSGRTSSGTREYSIDRMADDAAGLLSHLGVLSAFVLGHSMGGMIAQRLALDRPGMVDRLVLCSTNCGGLECIQPDRRVAEALEDGTGTLEEKACRYVSTLYPRKYVDEHAEELREMTERYLQSIEAVEDVPRQFMASVEFNACDEISRIGCPTLVACGALDAVIPAENSRILARRIPKARLLEYADTGHDFISQVPLRFASEVVSFLEGRG